MCTFLTGGSDRPTYGRELAPEAMDLPDRCHGTWEGARNKHGTWAFQGAAFRLQLWKAGVLMLRDGKQTGQLLRLACEIWRWLLDCVFGMGFRGMDACKYTLVYPWYEWYRSSIAPHTLNMPLINSVFALLRSLGA